jgi:transcription initiation factor TFIIIB Brf1 subunit/transcription initiation factor TFIIB
MINRDEILAMLYRSFTWKDSKQVAEYFDIPQSQATEKLDALVNDQKIETTVTESGIRIYKYRY